VIDRNDDDHDDNDELEKETSEEDEGVMHEGWCRNRRRHRHRKVLLLLEAICAMERPVRDVTHNKMQKKNGCILVGTTSNFVPDWYPFGW